MISVAKSGREAELFKLDARKLCGEDFFNAVMQAWGEAEKMPIERVVEMGILNINEWNEISEILASTL